MTNMQHAIKPEIETNLRDKRLS